MKTLLLIIAIVVSTISSWRWYATRPASEEVTRAVLEDWAHLKKMAEKFPYKERGDQ